MHETKIRWATASWNPMTGCTEISPGCDHCYAKVIAEKFRGGAAFPYGFDPVYKPYKLREPFRMKAPSRIFVNSMSDLHHEAFTDAQRDEVHDVMAEAGRHDYLVLTKRPQAMARYFLGGRDTKGWLERRGLDAVPDHIWLGTTIESDRYTFRANHLRRIPVLVRFLSCEPLITPLPSLDLSGIAWVIVGGESEPHGKYRPMDDEWAADLRDRCVAAKVAYFFKQHAYVRTEYGQELEGKRWEQYPLPHPALSAGRPRRLGIYVDTQPRGKVVVR